MAIEGRKYNSRVMGLAPGAYTRMTSDLPGRIGHEPDPLSLPEVTVVVSGGKGTIPPDPVLLLVSVFGFVSSAGA